MIPYFSKTFEFPAGTIITNIEITTGDIQTMDIERPLKPVPPLQKIGEIPIEQELIIQDIWNYLLQKKQ